MAIPYDLDTTVGGAVAQYCRVRDDLSAPSSCRRRARRRVEVQLFVEHRTTAHFDYVAGVQHDHDRLAARAAEVRFAGERYRRAHRTIGAVGADAGAP